ncbi:sporulation protein YqfD [Candidatus Contubernalis alkaliaceticus]|uniref:sporulation protein YqfD n=1 Tax=Candidatus Contubernalis alkaliaceticus TaxID=338645 RepID=UPI001F4BE71A|nr:sporulation protein YqfD [Candidatus Contubernalis alkalaceticus]UNC93130.1 sporulation protein YqfD [Candidatus Contubernalis alkalaceticus]
MSLIDLWYYMNGYITISIRGNRSERLINLAINRGIILRDIRRFDDTAYMKIGIEGFKKIRPLARRTRCKVKIEKKAGIPFFVYRLVVRKGFVAGAVLFVVLLYLLSSFVWYVEIVGTKEIDPQEVIEISQELGLKPGVFKNTLDVEKISNEIVLGIPDISWVGVELTGVRAKVDVVEKVKGVEPGEESFTHIIASKDGLITEIMVISGMADAKVGDTVTAGQVLISGIIRPITEEFEEDDSEEEENTFEDSSPKESYTRARGTVKARVWYEGLGVSTLQVKTYEPTGENYTSSYIKIGEREVYMEGDGQNPYNYARLSKSKRTMHWMNYKFPIEVIYLEYKELALILKELTPEEALAKAKQQAEQEAKKQLPSQGEVIDEYMEVLDTEDEQVIKARYVIETIEEIGQEKEVFMEGFPE